jgi:8-oxo-dGTP pyrophosphatase MutT (NUDIX family)
VTEARGSAAPPRIADPEAVPVTAVDTHLPPLAGERLTAAAVRERFATRPAFEPELPGDGGIVPAGARTSSASVLVPLVRRGHGLTVLLTRRTDHLRAHAGQISFPGGRQEPHDVDAVEAALRETEEEVGLSRRHVEVVGALPPYVTVTAFRVTPVVALVTPPFELALDAHEVDEAFEVPLPYLMTPAHHRWHAIEWGGRQRRFLSMPWTDPHAPAERYFIWGATAAMLRNLYRFLAD